MTYLNPCYLSDQTAQPALQSDKLTARAQCSPTVRTIRTMAELESVKEVWNTWCDDPAAEFEYFVASARCRADFLRPHVMVVYRGETPDCILVGRLERCQLKLKVGYRSLFAIPVRRLFFVQGGYLGKSSEENCRLLITELKYTLQRREADTIELTRMTAESPLFKGAKSGFNFLCRDHFTPFHEHRWIDLPGSFEQFLRGMPRKCRHEIRRHEKRIDTVFRGKNRIHCYRDEGEVEKLAQEVEKIASKTYQRTLGAGFQPEIEVLESLRISARKKGLRGCVLYLDERPSAFFIGKQLKNTFYGNFMGFDPQFAQYSPGLTVLMHSIEECFDRDLRAARFDFGWGDRRYKREICNGSQQDGPMYLYPLSWAGLKLNFLRSATSLLDQVARKLLKNSHLVQTLRKSWFRRIRSVQDVENCGQSIDTVIEEQS